MNSLLAIDYWTKKTWLAYSVGDFCFSLKTIPTVDVVKNITKILKEKNISTIVVGMPYNIDWSISKHWKNVLKFVKILESNFNIPIKLHDERLTTSEAKIFSYENNFEIDIDSESARLILEDFLENNKKNPS